MHHKTMKVRSKKVQVLHTRGQGLNMLVLLENCKNHLVHYTLNPEHYSHHHDHSSSHHSTLHPLVFCEPYLTRCCPYCLDFCYVACCVYVFVAFDAVLGDEVVQLNPGHHGPRNHRRMKIPITLLK